MIRLLNNSDREHGRIKRNSHIPTQQYDEIIGVP